MGLTGAEADQRLARHGANVLQVKDQVSPLVRFLHQFRNFFAILLLVGGGLAFLAEWLDPGSGNLYIGYALVGVTVLNALFTFIQEYQSEQLMESFRKMLPSRITALRDGRPREIEAASLVPGDVILLSEGDKVPADARLLAANELEVDLSSLTGESEPVKLDEESSAEVLVEARNMVFSGTLVQSGDGRALVCATGMDTQIGNIVRLTKETDEVETPIRRELKHFIRIISGIAIFLGIAFFLVSWSIGNPALGSLIFAIGIIVANVPEGLLPTVTLALGMASKRMAGKNALIKNLESVETLGSTTVICTDKTGTLTQNRLSVSTLLLGGREYRYDDRAAAAAPGFEHVLRAMVLCNNAHPTIHGGYAGDATEGALLAYADAMQSLDGFDAMERVAEQPFESSLRRMTTVNRTPGAVHPYGAFIKGAPEVILELCDRILVDGEERELGETECAEVLAGYHRLAERAERGLALAWQPVNSADVPERGFTFIGIVGMLDPPRPEVADAISRCRSAGIRVAMITGDYGLTALSIAREIGLVRGEGKVIHGDDLAAGDITQGSLLDAPELVFARVSPLQKLDIVRAFQARGEIVTMTGDGVNDAPALKNADMGVAMGQLGTDVAKEASDMVLMDDNFATIVAAVEEGRTIYDNIKKFIAYILTSNIPEILPFIAFVLLGIPLPLTVVLILAIDLGTDILPALGLGAEKAETDVMRRAPRSRNERLLTPTLLGISYGIVGMMQAAAGFFTYFTILSFGGWEWGDALAGDDLLYRTAVTGFFASIIICQVADVLICRTRRQSLFSVGAFSNRLVWLGIGAELMLLALIAYVPAFNTFFGTAPLEAWQLALSVPFAIAILLGDELRRVFVRRGNRFVLKYLTW